MNEPLSTWWIEWLEPQIVEAEIKAGLRPPREPLMVMHPGQITGMPPGYSIRWFDGPMTVATSPRTQWWPPRPSTRARGATRMDGECG